MLIPAVSFAEGETAADYEVVEFAEGAVLARESAYAARETALAAREAKAARREAIDFAEQLVADGRVLPRHKDAVVDLLTVVAEDATVSFADAATPAPVGKSLREFLASMPVQVHYGEIATPASDPYRARRDGVNMAMPSGFSLSPDKTELHNRVVDFAESQGLTYTAALVKVLSK